MELKDYIDSLKAEKKDILSSLTYSILKAEETLVENSTDNIKVVESLKGILESSFLFIKENKIEFKHKEFPHLDLDHWKNNIKVFSIRNGLIDGPTFLYSLRNGLKYLLETKKDAKKQKAFIFEIIIKTFLYIDYLNLSIDSILAS